MADHVAVWNGTAWSALGKGEGLISQFTLAIGGDSTTNVYAGGIFPGGGGIRTVGVARFDGKRWSPLGTGLRFTSDASTECRGIAVAGSNVYVGGQFTNAGGVSVSNVARWNGSNWFPLCVGVGSNVQDVVYHNGLLYVCGRFTTAGGASANRIASWNGSVWSPLGSGLDFSGTVMVGSGSDLYVGGTFTNAGGIVCNRIAKWNAGSWSALGTGLSGGSPSSLAVIGSNLYAGGSFTTAGGVSALRIARWNGSTWSDVGGGIGAGNISAMTAVGSNLYVGGTMTLAGGLPVNRLARWDGTNWSSVGSGVGHFVNSAASVFAMHTIGNNLYLGGPFTLAGQSVSKFFARCNDQIDFR
jgi:hypothetical protein